MHANIKAMEVKEQLVIMLLSVEERWKISLRLNDEHKSSSHRTSLILM